MFIYMYVNLHFRIDIKSVVSPDLKGKFFFGCRLKMVFPFVTKKLEMSYLSLCILRHESFDIDDLSSMQDDPLCIHCMSWLIKKKSIAMWVNFRL